MDEPRFYVDDPCPLDCVSSHRVHRQLGSGRTGRDLCLSSLTFAQPRRGSRIWTDRGAVAGSPFHLLFSGHVLPDVYQEQPRLGVRFLRQRAPSDYVPGSGYQRTRLAATGSSTQLLQNSRRCSCDLPVPFVDAVAIRRAPPHLILHSPEQPSLQILPVTARCPWIGRRAHARVPAPAGPYLAVGGIDFGCGRLRPDSQQHRSHLVGTLPGSRSLFTGREASDLVRMQLGPELNKLPFIWFDRTAPLANDFCALSSALICGGALRYIVPSLNGTGGQPAIVRADDNSYRE